MKDLYTLLNMIADYGDDPDFAIVLEMFREHGPDFSQARRWHPHADIGEARQRLYDVIGCLFDTYAGDDGQIVYRLAFDPVALLDQAAIADERLANLEELEEA